jgi:hypothetical protein
MKLAVYVPRPGTLAAVIIDAGSGIIGTREGDRLLADYEGARYSFQSSWGYADRVMHAAKRHASNYPTIARGLFALDELEQIGVYDDQLGTVTLAGPEAAERLSEWLGRLVVEADLHTSASLHRRRRRMTKPDAK